jgi:hypothetical protein
MALNDTKFDIINKAGTVMTVPDWQGISYQGLNIIGNKTEDWNASLQENFLKIVDRLDKCEVRKIELDSINIIYEYRDEITPALRIGIADLDLIKEANKVSFRFKGERSSRANYAFTTIINGDYTRAYYSSTSKKISITGTSYIKEVLVNGISVVSGTEITGIHPDGNTIEDYSITFTDTLGNLGIENDFSIGRFSVSGTYKYGFNNAYVYDVIFEKV